jgi:hypothetical protein
MPHDLVALLSQPIDLDHAVVAVLIGLSGGAFLAELRLKPLVRAFARKLRPVETVDHGGPWG